MTTSWQIIKQYNFSVMNAVRSDWTIGLFVPGVFGNDKQAYVDSNETLYIRDGHLIMRAYRRENDTYDSSRLLSKQSFTPADYDSKQVALSLDKMI
jgi:hypothetical protein